MASNNNGNFSDNNINNGTIQEIPELHIDIFTEDSVNWDINRAFILTHAHLDHVYGLFGYFLSELEKRTKGSTKYRLYMHTITFPYLIYHIKRLKRGGEELIRLMDILRDRKNIVLVEKNKPYYLRFVGEYGIKECCMTPLSAGHCPGSIMLKFEIPTLRILYTGDCRVNLCDLMYTSNLRANNNLDSILSVDILYVDTTFLFSEQFPTRRSIFDDLYTYLENSMKIYGISQSPPQYMICMAGHLTHAYVALRCFNKLKVPVCAGKEVNEFCEQVNDLRGVTQYNPSCSKENKCLLPFHVQDPPNYWNKNALDCLSENQFQILLQATVPVGLGLGWNQDGIMEDESGRRLFPGQYSTHLDHQGISLIISLLKPSVVIPLVKSKGKSVAEVEAKLIQLKRETELLNRSVDYYIAELEIQNEVKRDFPSFVHDFTGENFGQIPQYVVDVDIFIH